VLAEQNVHRGYGLPIASMSGRMAGSCASSRISAWDPDRVSHSHMSGGCDIWAVVPVKDTGCAKQRLAGVLSAHVRQQLALAMLEDVLQTIAAVPELTGIAVVTIDPTAVDIALRLGARVWSGGARDGHTGAVTAAARRLAAHGSTMLTIPGDVPLISPADVRHLLDIHRREPGFTIVPARDQRGSNAIVSSPADLVPLRFGADSFFPHLAAARACGVEPTTVHLPRIALDIDEPADLAEFMKIPSATRTRGLLDQLELAADKPALP
jgi:2-phospho-L-lactate guanylyltransferase